MNLEAQMKWEYLLSQKRLGQEDRPSSPPDHRSAFESDVDRVIFSSAFRRLSRKSQVHPLAANDHVHTRLTHSLEVARVGKSLGKSLGLRIKQDLPPSFSEYHLAAIVQAACLAHDIGNPPFGHGGEQAMRHWLDRKGKELLNDLSAEYRKDIVTFEGNAQGFRVITQTENHLFLGGIRLTYATLGAFLKYPWTILKKDPKFSIFLAEKDILDKIAEELGLVKLDTNEWARHPLAYLVEAADDICYAIMDLEDAVELNIIQYEQVEELFLSELDCSEKANIQEDTKNKKWHRVNFSRIRGRIFAFLISGAIECFMNNYEKIMDGLSVGNLFESLPDGDHRKNLIMNAKDFTKNFVFSDQKKVELELGAYATLESLLNAFCQAAIDCGKSLQGRKGGNALNYRSNLILKLLGDHSPAQCEPPPHSCWDEYQCLRRVLDFVSGMTDNYATYIAKQLQGMGFAGLQRP